MIEKIDVILKKNIKTLKLKALNNFAEQQNYLFIEICALTWEMSYQMCTVAKRLYFNSEIDAAVFPSCSSLKFPMTLNKCGTSVFN